MDDQRFPNDIVPFPSLLDFPWMPGHRHAKTNSTGHLHLFFCIVLFTIFLKTLYRNVKISRRCIANKRRVMLCLWRCPVYNILWILFLFQNGSYFKNSPSFMVITLKCNFNFHIVFRLLIFYLLLYTVKDFFTQHIFKYMS